MKLPDGKFLIPGVVSHSTDVVEHPELIALRIKDFVPVVGRENVIAAPIEDPMNMNWVTTVNRIRLGIPGMPVPRRAAP